MIDVFVFVFSHPDSGATVESVWSSVTAQRMWMGAGESGLSGATAPAPVGEGWSPARESVITHGKPYLCLPAIIPQKSNLNVSEIRLRQSFLNNSSILNIASILSNWQFIKCKYTLKTDVLVLHAHECKTISVTLLKHVLRMFRYAKHLDTNFKLGSARYWKPCDKTRLRDLFYDTANTPLFKNIAEMSRTETRCIYFTVQIFYRVTVLFL